MVEVMTATEIHWHYPSKWVLLEDPQTNAALEVQGGRVLHHSKDRDEVYRQAVQFRPKRFAVLYTGTMPGGTEIVLHSVPAVIERCEETHLYVGYLPGMVGAHSQAETLDELYDNLREVLELLSEEDDPTAISGVHDG